MEARELLDDIYERCGKQIDILYPQGFQQRCKTVDHTSVIRGRFQVYRALQQMIDEWKKGEKE